MSAKRDKRRSFLTPSVNVRHEQPLSLGSVGINDDERERREQRRPLPGAETPATTSTSRISVGKEKISKMTATERSNHVDKCMQLNAENKISTKNAFSLHLIDMTLERIKKDDSNNFQVASTHLDASAKIYACRVDNVHMEAMRIAGGLIDSEKGSKKKRAVNEDGEEEINAEVGNDPNNSGDDLETTTAKAKKTKKLRQKDIIVKRENIAQINSTAHLTTQNSNEGFLHDLITSAEASEPGNCYFISNFEVTGNTCELMVLADIQSYRQRCGEELSPATVILSVMTRQQPTSNMPYVADLPICPELKSLLDPDQDPMRNDEEDDAMDYRACGDAEHVADDNEDDYDMGSVNDDIDIDETVGTVAAPEACRAAHEPNANVVDFTSSIAAQLLGPLQYSLYNRKSINFRGGPGNWRVGNLPFVSARPSSCIKKVVTKRKTKDPVELLYEEDETLFFLLKRSAKVELTEARMKIYSTQQSVITSMLQDNSLSRFEKLHVNDTAQVFGACCKKKVDEKKTSQLNMSMDYADDDGIGGVDDDVCTDNGAHISTGMSFTSFHADDELHVSLTNKENAIPFAMRAKKIDMKLLKATIWNILQDADNNKENAISPPILFSKLYQDLPLKLSARMVLALTPHLAFMALLHLANEQNLSLKDQENLLDIEVTFEVYE